MAALHFCVRVLLYCYIGYVWVCFRLCASVSLFVSVDLPITESMCVYKWGTSLKAYLGHMILIALGILLAKVYHTYDCTKDIGVIVYSLPSF